MLALRSVRFVSGLARTLTLNAPRDLWATQTRCPKCMTIDGTKWEILNGACSELPADVRVGSIATEMQCPPATQQRTSGDVSNVPNTRRSRLYAKDGLVT